MSRCAPLAALVFLLGLSGCEGPQLFVDLKTDLTPGIDFHAVRTEVLHAGGGEPVQLAALFEEDYIAGRRIAEVGGVEPGSVTVRVALLDAVDEVVAERSIAADVDSDFGLTVIITRDCLGVMCAGTGPEGASCQSGECVDERCSPETPATCPPPQCAADAECMGGAACAAGRCADGVCLYEGRHEMCPAGQFCDADRGCLDDTPLPPGEDVPVLLRAGYHHTCALYSNGGVKCWGNNDAGQLGYGHLETLGDEPGEIVDGSLQFLNFGTTERVVDIGAGQWHSCALFASGRVKCWGQNQAGALGNEACCTFGDQPGELAMPTTDYIMPTGLTPVQMDVRKRNVCIIYDDGSLRCSGQNDYGQLGTESFESLGDDPGEMGDGLQPIDLGGGAVRDVVLGEYHACALLADGAVKCWGRNHYGRLGYGDTAHRGGSPGDMGDGLPPVDLGAGRAVVDLHRGWFGNCATFDDGSPTCWGGNIRGELGLGNTDNVGDDGGEMGDALPDFAAGLAVTAVLGGYHVWCVVDDARALRCLGRNDLGQLGVGDAVNHGGNAGETWAAQPPIDLGTGRTLRGTSDHNIAHGLEHVCALTDDFRIRCWGSNNLGQLFVGDTDNRGDDPGEMGDALGSFRP